MDGASAWQARVEAARVSPAVFSELAITDEKTGAPVVLCPMHVEWLQLVREHDRVALMSHIESGKTSLLGVAYALWLLGTDPTTRIAIAGSTFAAATKILGMVRRMIERPSAELAAVFPGLRPSPSGPWRDDCFTVARPNASKDPSVVATGLGGTGSILGSRVDHLLADDLITWENARTDTQRQAVADWFRSSEVSGRVVEGGRMIVIGTSFHSEDLLGRLAESPSWVSRRYSVEDDDGVPRWPEKWSPARIALKRQELGPYESSRQLDVCPVSDSDQRLRLEWIDLALTKGKKKPFPSGARPAGEPGVVVVGVDLAVSLKASADETALVAVMVHPDESREVLGIEAGRWEAPAIVDRIASLARRHNASAVVVESVAAQKYVSQYLAHDHGISVENFQTGTGEKSLQWLVENLGVELSRSQWIFPADDQGRPAHPELRRLIRDMLSYSPSAHTGDRLAALLFAAHGAREFGFRMPSLREAFGPLFRVR